MKAKELRLGVAHFKTVFLGEQVNTYDSAIIK